MNHLFILNFENIISCFFSGFSVIDLLEDARTHKLYALKRITCHGKIDERVAMREIEVMKSFKCSNLVPLEVDSMITVGRHIQSDDAITEVHIVMPYYRVISDYDTADLSHEQFKINPFPQICSRRL